jgi:hypothetical protein
MKNSHKIVLAFLALLLIIGIAGAHSNNGNTAGASTATPTTAFDATGWAIKIQGQVCNLVGSGMSVSDIENAVESGSNADDPSTANPVIEAAAANC